MSAYFLYTDIPGAGKNWTLAVYAVNRKDANEYIKRMHTKGKFLRKITTGTVDASCGAITDQAHEQIRNRVEV